MSDHTTDAPEIDAEAPDPHVQDQLDAWTLFEMRLAVFLSTLADGDHFTLHVPVASETDTQLQVQITGDCAQVKLLSAVLEGCTLTWDQVDHFALGRYVATAEEVTRIVRSTGLPHPGLMTVTMPWNCGGSPEVLGLAGRLKGSSNHPVTPASPAQTDVAEPSNTEELRSLAEHVLRTLTQEVVRVEDGDLLVAIDGQRFWVHVTEHQPAILVYAPLLRDVESKRDTDRELNRMNRHAMWTRWVRYGRKVRVEHVTPGVPFVPETFRQMITIFVGTLSDNREQLPVRLNATLIE
ncbi:T3SS (YopN, CesT) and YbjN peptide-binding chaperone 1 [Propionibacteriaceae bacterium Y1700]|uniref:T3SS (YopN, CesT) and YbjN peptide-binding chaperone 1 n=1 Tax=Microlunatus sp. Y1700 TaxID=3418487 RepID=UPI003DA70A25